MPHSIRRLATATAIALGVALPAVAANKQIDAAKLFTHYDAYLKIPPAERSRFTMAFYLRQGGQPFTAPVWLVEGERKIPLPLRADGHVDRLPTLSQLADKVELGVDAGTKLSLEVGLEPLIAPAQDYDARELAAAVAQAGPGMKKIAGVLALALPTPKGVRFVGVASGEAELADGRRVALPLVKGVPEFAPASLPTATRIHLSKVPTKLAID